MYKAATDELVEPGLFTNPGGCNVKQQNLATIGLAVTLHLCDRISSGALLTFAKCLNMQLCLQLVNLNVLCPSGELNKS